MTLGAGAREHHFALCLEFSEWRINVRQGSLSISHRIGQHANPGRGEKNILKCGEIVEHLLWRRRLNLRVSHECPERLLLQIRLASIELISAGGIGTARPGNRAVGPGQFHVENTRHGAPYIDRGLGRRRVGGRIDEANVGGQRHGHPDQAVFAQVAEVTRRLAVDAKIVGVDRQEQRILRQRIPAAPPLQQLEASFGAGGRKLQVVSGMWQSAQERPLACRPWSRRSRKVMRPRAIEAQFSPPQRSMEFAGRTLATASSSGSPACTSGMAKADASAIAMQVCRAEIMAMLPNARMIAVATDQDAVASRFVPLRSARFLPRSCVLAYRGAQMAQAVGRQKISHQEWRQVFALLDTALELPAQARDSWLDQLEHQPAQVTNALRELLARQASREIRRLSPATAAHST